MPRVWLHLIASTYGSWLPGDPRGFRTQHHREHVEGDYKHPPPKGKYADRHAHARRLQKSRSAVVPVELRETLGRAFLEQLILEGGRVLAIAASGQHVHVQVQLDDCDALIPLGKAKLHGWFKLRERGWKTKLWAKRGKVIRIDDHQHQKNVYWYIVGHRKEGAWVWSELEEQGRAEGV